MSKTRSRSEIVQGDDELRLPRPPGVFRRFWARHPIITDLLIAAVCVLGPIRMTPINAQQSVVEFGSLWPPLPTALAAIACVTLLWRRQMPMIAFIASFALHAALLLVAPDFSYILPIASCYALAVYGTARVAWSAYAIAAIALIGVYFALQVNGADTASYALTPPLAFGLIGLLVGFNIAGRKRYLAAVIDRSQQLLVERDQQAQLAAAAERARIAREMHDIVSHSLTVIVALSEGAAATSDVAQARSAATTAAATARGALTEMRAMLGVLRDDRSPLAMTPLEPIAPIVPVTAAQRAGFPVTFTVTGNAAVAPAVAHAIGRIVQEGLTNAMRYAPATTPITVRLDYTPETVSIEIINDRAEGPVGTSGFGVRGLIERGLHVNGSVSSAPSSGGKWVLLANLPADGTAPDTTSHRRTE